MSYDIFINTFYFGVNRFIFRVYASMKGPELLFSSSTLIGYIEKQGRVSIMALYIRRLMLSIFLPICIRLPTTLKMNRSFESVKLQVHCFTSLIPAGFTVAVPAIFLHLISSLNTNSINLASSKPYVKNKYVTEYFIKALKTIRL